MKRLPILGQSDGDRSTILVEGANWQVIEIIGWDHGPKGGSSEYFGIDALGELRSQYPEGDLVVKNDGEAPPNIKIELYEPAFIFGDANTLSVVSQSFDKRASISIQRASGESTDLSKSFKIADQG